MGHPRPLFRFYFRLFKQILQFLQQINVKKVHPVCSSGICNSQTSEYESTHITTRAGLPPFFNTLVLSLSVGGTRTYDLSHMCLFHLVLDQFSQQETTRFGWLNCE